MHLFALHCCFILWLGTFEVTLRCAQMRQSKTKLRSGETMIHKLEQTEREATAEVWLQEAGDECSFMAANRAKTPGRKQRKSPRRKDTNKKCDSGCVGWRACTFHPQMLAVLVVCVYILINQSSLLKWREYWRKRQMRPLGGKSWFRIWCHVARGLRVTSRGGMIMRRNKSQPKCCFYKKCQKTNTREWFFSSYTFELHTIDFLSCSANSAAWTPHPPHLDFPLTKKKKLLALLLLKCHFLMESVTRSNNQLTGDKPRLP